MVPPRFDTREPQIRPFFRVLGVLLLFAMAAALVAGSIPLLINPGPAEVACPTNTRKFACELGATIVGSIPAGAQRTVLGLTGLASTAGIFGLAWIFVWRKTR
jgi:hypothetical protein